MVLGIDFMHSHEKKLSFLNSFFFILVCLNFSSALSQEVKLKFFDNSGNSISNIILYNYTSEVYNSGDSNVIHVRKKDLGKDFIVSKFGYEEIKIIIKGNESIYLNNFRIEELSEVLITNITIASILDSVRDRLLSKGTYQYSNYLKIRKQLMRENDTMFFLNERYVFKDANALFEQQSPMFNRISYDTIRTNNYNKISIKNYVDFNSSKIHVPSFALKSSIPVSIMYNPYIKIVLSERDRFDYSFSKINDGKIRVDFEQKGKKESYNGYLICDVDDYGIYELYYNMKPSKKNEFHGRILPTNKKSKVKFNIIEHSYYTSYHKEEGLYKVETCAEKIEFVSTYNKKKESWVNFRAFEKTNPFDIQNPKILDHSKFKALDLNK